MADLAARLPGTIALLGDIVYENGSPSDYATCLLAPRAAFSGLASKRGQGSAVI